MIHNNSLIGHGRGVNHPTQILPDSKTSNALLVPGEAREARGSARGAMVRLLRLDFLQISLTLENQPADTAPNIVAAYLVRSAYQIDRNG